MKKNAGAWIKGLAKYGIGIGLLAYILRTNWDPKGTSPGISGLVQQTPDALAFLALALIAIACVCVQFYRWFVLVRALDLPFTVGGAFRLGLVGAFYNAFLPGSVGGDLVKAFFIARDTPGRRASAVATVIADRLVGLFGLIWFSAAFGGAYWLSGDARIADNDYMRKIVVACAGLTAGTVIVWIAMGFLPRSRADRFAGRLKHVPKLGATLAEAWYAVWTYRQRPKVIYLAVAMTAAVHLGFVLMFHLAVRVFPAVDPATLAEHFVVAPIGYIAQAFFPAPGGLGGGEFIFGYLYTLLGRPEATGVVGRLTMRVAEWGIGLVGLVVFLRMKAHHELPEEEPDAITANEVPMGPADQPAAAAPTGGAAG
ncbi:lysylphosphatidylglycerol synthase transmembrane domain-containing protein [Gemmata sp.]|uniref:lysylphosphatidylglycerol synthase transmembrane domain-containing protein n=1 Tax=Gemmata sp. TaxID=1914242 RepID=UPI003F6F6842